MAVYKDDNCDEDVIYEAFQPHSEPSARILILCPKTDYFDAMLWQQRIFSEIQNIIGQRKPFLVASSPGNPSTLGSEDG